MTLPESKRRPPRGALARTLVLLGAVALTGCGNPYLKATGAFATATNAGVDAFAPAFDTASSLCRTRAELDFLEHRLEGTTRPNKWSQWYKTHTIPRDPKRTWEAHCAKLAEGDELLQQGITALSAYAGALEAVAKAGDYDGQSLTSTVERAADLAKALDTGGSARTDVIKAMAAPIGALGGWVVKTWTKGQVKRAIIDVADPVTKILDAMTAYNEATKAEILDAEGLLATALDHTDTLLVAGDAARPGGDGLAKPAVDVSAPQGPGFTRPAPGEALKVTEFFDTARRYEEDLRRHRRAYEGYKQVIARLRSAQASLLAAAKEEKTDKAALQEVLGAATEILGHVKAIKTALAEKE